MRWAGKVTPATPPGTFSETRREVGLLRVTQEGVIVSDCRTLTVEILTDNERPEATEARPASAKVGRPPSSTENNQREPD